MKHRNTQDRIEPGELTAGALRSLVCPSCRAALEGPPDGAVRGPVRCSGCGESWPFSGGFLRLYRESEVKGTDRLMRALYDAVPALHDPATHYLLPLLQLGGSERGMRDAYMKRVDLGSLKARPDGSSTSARILEIGVGSGANLSLLARDLPPQLKAEVWGIDLSEGMLKQCVRWLKDGLIGSGIEARLLMADAHALPFPDGFFDRVFHVGALGSFRDPRRALAEMARVARPGTPIVVVDEQLDRSRKNTLYHRAAFRLLTFYDSDPHCPRELLPEGATGIIDEQISRFYYCLTFKMPATS